MPKTKAKIIEVEATCPECGSVFESGWPEKDMLDPEVDLVFDCPDCDCEFGRTHTYDAATGKVTLSEASTVTAHGDQYTGTPEAATDEEEGDDSDDEADEDDDEDDNEDEEEDEGEEEV